jgi:hypothetical protein
MRIFFYIVFVIPVVAYVIIGRAPTRSAPMTKTKSIVLVCAICLFIGLALYLVPLHETQHIKSKMSSVTYSMSSVASAVEAYHQDENSWPHCDGVIAIQTSLGTIFRKETTDRISSMTVTSLKSL